MNVLESKCSLWIPPDESAWGIGLLPGGDAPATASAGSVEIDLWSEAGRPSFSGDMRERLVARRREAALLRAAYEHGELHLEYQPQFAARTGAVIGAEALLRWRSPAGPVSPGAFVPVAEESGFIGVLGAWALAEACAQARRWQGSTGERISVGVNVSARQLHGEQLLAQVDAVLEESGLDPRLLELELTESQALCGACGATGVLKALKDRGVRLSIDDFGTGYSSLGYLLLRVFDTLKIDRSFIRELPDDPGSAAIVEAIVRTSHALGLRVVAEGVETAEQLAYLREAGCDAVQGFLLSRPVRPEAVEGLLQAPSQAPWPPVAGPTKFGTPFREETAADRFCIG